MKLSPNEKKVLSALHLDADAPLSMVASKTRLPLHSIHYCIRSLAEREIIRKVPYVDVYRIGLTSHGILLSINAEDRRVHRRFQKYVGGSKGVSYLAELGGEYQYKIGVNTRNLSELREFIDKLAIEFGPIMFQKAVTSHLALYDFPLAYLLGDYSRVKSLSWGTNSETVEVDDVDHAILNSLTRANFNSNREISRALGMANSTFEYRLNRLRDAKVLVGSRYLIDTARFGVYIYMILLFTRGLSADFRKRLRRFSMEHGNIRYLTENLGAWDFELGVETLEARTMSDITLDIYEQFGNDILAIKVLPVFNNLKIESYPF